MRTPRRTTTAAARTPPRPPVSGRRAHARTSSDETTDEPPVPTPVRAPTPTRVRRWRTRPRTVRAKVVCLLLVPVVSLLALWAYATVSTAQDVSRLRRSQYVDSVLRTPVATAVSALQTERAAAVRYATDPATGQSAELRELAAHTDRSVAALRLGKDRTVADGAEELPETVSVRLTAFVTAARDVRGLRAAVLDHRVGWETTYRQYTRAIETAFGVDGALTGVQADGVGADARVLLEFSRAREALAQEDVLLAGARLTGTLRSERLRLFTGAVDTRRTLVATAAVDLPETQRATWRRLAYSDAYKTLGATEEAVLAGSPGPRATATAPEATWSASHARVRDGMRAIETDAARTVAGRADPFARALLTSAGAAVLFGLLAVAASLVISVRIGSALVVELVSLRNSALEIAHRKLPEALRRLRSGEDIDIEAEAPPGPPAEDETGQVAAALGTVHRAALRAAVERAQLADGVSRVFVNLARRSQILVHRQLSLLDSMERRSDDPDELSDLFRLDHLTTRMRRHAESLIILSGAAPGRAWRTPVSLTDVVRAAVAEVEDYARVDVRRLCEASVVGTAVADITHLLAELIENAAQFSPPHTRVRVTGEPVGNGYAVEVEDRGLGMGQETLTEANRRIERPEALDLLDSDRLGLFVVGRLAVRHGIKVHLKTSPYGGTTAVVLLPTTRLHSGTTARSLSSSAKREATGHARVPVLAQHQKPAAAPAERPAPAAALPAPRHPATGSALPGTGTSWPHHTSKESGGLPRRVRQASLSPRLRVRGTEEPDRQPALPDDRRTPELVRDRMTAYRAGWTRGGGAQPGRAAPPDPEPGTNHTEGDPV